MPYYQGQEISKIEDYHKELTHVWGLAGKIEMHAGSRKFYLGSAKPLFMENIGWGGLYYLYSNQKRFVAIQHYMSKLSSITPPKFSHICPETTEFDNVRLGKEIDQLKVNNMVSLDIETEKHCSSLHIIKTSAGYDVVYVNRGDKSYMNNQHNVQIYSFASSTPIHNLLHICKTIEKDYANDTKKLAIAKVFNSSEWAGNYSQSKSLLIEKVSQKVGNCTVSNLNIAWHLALALNKAQTGEALNYIFGYLLTIDDYKQMRVYDRAIKLVELIKNNKKYAESSYYALLATIITKSYRKGDDFMRDLLVAVNKIDSESVDLLYRDVKYLFDTNYVNKNYSGVLNNVLECTFKNDVKNPIITQQEVATAIQFTFRKMLCDRISSKLEDLLEKYKSEQNELSKLRQGCTFKYQPVRAGVDKVVDYPLKPNLQRISAS